MDYAIELDPQNPWVIAFSAAMYFHDGKLLSAAKHSERLVKIAPGHPMANMMLLGKYIALNEQKLALIELKKYVKVTRAPNLDQIFDKASDNGDFKSTVKTVVTYLEEYSAENFVPPGKVYHLYAILEDKEKQLEWLLKMFEVNDSNLPYYAIRNSDPIQKDPRYELIMKEIDLW